MADILKLSEARKARDKAADKARAAENRVKFGRTKAEKAADKHQAAKLNQDLERHRRDAPASEPAEADT